MPHHSLIRWFAVGALASIASLCVAAGDVSTFSQPLSDSSQASMDVLHCDLSITLDNANWRLSDCAMTMTAQCVSGSLTEVALDFNDNVGNLVVSAVEASPSMVPLLFNHAVDEELLHITLPTEVASGEEFTFTVFYSGVPSVEEFGGLFASLRGGVPTIFTQSQPHSARLWWPCKDHPSDKFTMDFHITVDDVLHGGYPLSVVCNGVLSSIDDNGDGTVTYNWTERYPIHSQYVSFSCTNFRTLTGTYTGVDGLASMEISHHFYPEEFDASIDPVSETIETMDFYASLFGEYPFIDDRYSTVSWPRTIGLENQTCSNLHPDAVFSHYQVVAVHELAHMWFGCGVGVRDFDHLWLAEGWASYCEAVFYGHIGGDSAFQNQMDTFDTSDVFPVVSDHADEFNVEVIYHKGAWVLHMLRHLVGDEDFFQATRNFMTDPALRHGTAVTDDFRHHFEAVTGRDLSWFFDQWLLRASHPNCAWTWKWRPNGPTNEIEMMIGQVQADSPYVIPIDFEIEFADASTTTITVTSESAFQSFLIDIGTKIPTAMTFDPGHWLLVDSHLAVPPPAPTLRSVRGDGALDQVAFTWSPPDSAGVVGQRLYVAYGASGEWTLEADEDELASPETSHTISIASPEEMLRVRMTAIGELEGPPSDTYAVRMASGETEILVVDGFDLWNSMPASDGENHAIGVMYGQSIGAAAFAFDMCANEAVGQEIAIGDYDTVVWFTGDEGASGEALSATERSLIASHLQAGGRLFLTGNRIAGGLSGESAFLSGTLHAELDGDMIGATTLVASGENLALGSGVYAISPLSGSAEALVPVWAEPAAEYGSGGIAGVQVQGYFGGDGPRGTLVFLGVGFESLTDAGDRDAVMANVLQWLMTEPRVSGVVFLGAL